MPAKRPRPHRPPEPRIKPRRSVLAQSRVSTRLHLHLHLQTPDTDPPLTRWLTRHLRRLAALEGVTSGELSILIVDNRTMSRMHWRHMKVRGPTDVMTFDLRGSPRDPLEGDIVISRDIAEREARRRGHATRLEVLLYALHGLLHLCGYDDHRQADYKRMHAREDELLRAAGLGDVFGR